MSDLYPVKPHVADRAHVNSMAEYERLYRLSLDNPEWFWAEQAKALNWYHPWENVFDADYDEVDFAWFSGGRLNACFNCVDRHVHERGEQTAIIWAKDEPGEYEHITYRQLKHNVARVANVLKAHGVKKGDRIAIYMPMIPELAYTMLACARLGAIHSIIFGGFSADAIRDRLAARRDHIATAETELSARISQTSNHRVRRVTLQASPMRRPSTQKSSPAAVCATRRRRRSVLGTFAATKRS